MSQKKIELQSLIVSSIVNFIMAVAGIAVFAITNLQALFLDGVFSLIAFISTIMAIVFSQTSKKKNKSYPTGMFFLEPLYGIIKAILMFVLLATSLFESGTTAFVYFNTGVGSTIYFDPILPYTIIMVVMCFGLSYFNKKQNERINKSSIMLTAESKSNMVDGIISGGVGILILLLSFINIDGKLGFLHYTGDFFITLILVVVSIKQPIVLFGASLREISGATVKDKEIKSKVRKIVAKEIREEDLDNKFEVYKIGMHIKVVILLNDNVEKETLQRLKTETIKEIKESFDSVSVEFVLRK